MSGSFTEVSARLQQLFSRKKSRRSPVGMALAGLIAKLDEINRFAELKGLPVVNDDFQEDPSTRPIRISDAILPPLLFYLALVLLFPSPSSRWMPVRIVRLALALASAYTFMALPYRFHVPGSAILSYQLGLVGWYGGPRVLDLLVMSKSVPKRVKHVDGKVLTLPETTSFTERPRKHHPSLHKDVDHRTGIRSNEMEEVPLEQGLFARLAWALDLMISMRGVGWDYASSDVRHSSRSWHPPPQDRIYALCLYILPSLIGSLSVMKHVFIAIDDLAKQKDVSLVKAMGYSLLWLSPPMRFIGVASCGIALYTLFDASYTIASIVLGTFFSGYRKDLTQASSTNNLASMPPLCPLPATEATSIRSFWSRCWHRLFARLFLVWGVRPGQRIQQGIAGLFGIKTNGDAGKVIGAFAVSAIVHGQGERAALGKRAFRIYGHKGLILPLAGEPLFFMLSAVGILIESAVREPIMARRRRSAKAASKDGKIDPADLERPWDKPIGAIWTVGFLLWSGVFFIEGWVNSGIVKELTFSGLRWNW